MIKHEGGKYKYYSESTGKLLGEHDTIKKLYAQIYAIKKSKERKRKRKTK